MDGTTILFTLIYIVVNGTFICFCGKILLFVLEKINYILDLVSTLICIPLQVIKETLIERFKSKVKLIPSKETREKLDSNKYIKFFGGTITLFTFIVLLLIAIVAVCVYRSNNNPIDLYIEIFYYTVIGSFVSYLIDMDNFTLSYFMSVGIACCSSLILLKRAENLHFIVKFVYTIVSILSFSLIGKGLNFIIDFLYKTYLKVFTYIKSFTGDGISPSFFDILLFVGAIIVFVVLLYLGIALLSVGLKDITQSFYIALVPILIVSFILSIFMVSNYDLPDYLTYGVIIICTIAMEYLKTQIEYWSYITENEDAVALIQAVDSFIGFKVVEYKKKRNKSMHIILQNSDGLTVRMEFSGHIRCSNRFLEEEQIGRVYQFNTIIADNDTTSLIESDTETPVKNHSVYWVDADILKYHIK